MTTSSPSRSNVFISYSHKDKKFAERLKAHLVTSAREARVFDWTDTLITPGSHWQEAIERSLETAKIAFLLVSADFLASKFVIEHELSPLLVKAQREEVLVDPVILSPCAFGSTDLAQFQAFNSPSKPLTKLSRSEQEDVWSRLAKFVSGALNTPEPSLLLSSLEESSLLIYGGHSREVRSVAWSPDGHLIASGSADNTVQIWEAVSGKQLYIF